MPNTHVTNVTLGFSTKNCNFNTGCIFHHYLRFGPKIWTFRWLENCCRTTSWPRQLRKQSPVSEDQIFTSRSSEPVMTYCPVRSKIAAKKKGKPTKSQKWWKLQSTINMSLVQSHPVSMLIIEPYNTCPCSSTTDPKALKYITLCCFIRVCKF